MRERLEKRLKSVLKKKVKLTLGVLISFLTTGNIGYAKIINEENISSTLIIEENQEIENSGIISGNANVTEADIVFNGSGVIITSTSNLENLIDITNSGIISGNASIVGTNISVNGNGVIITSTSNLENLIDITNSGIISGNASIVGTNISVNGNGVIITSTSNLENLIDITNSGIISGNASITENASITGNTSIIGTNISVNGNGVVATGNLENLIDITNSGIISGNANVTEDASITGNASIIGTNISGNGNGVVITSNLESLINITNSGIISGNASIIGTDINSNGNGVIITINLESLTNTGVISGGIIYPLLEEGNSIHILDMSGNGIVREYISNNIVNNGIIKGSTSAIAAQSISGAVINNGILAGREIFSNSYEIHMFETTNSILQEINLNTITPTTEINNGIYVKLESETSERNDGNATGNVKVDSSGNPIIEEIEIGTGGKVTLEDGSEKTIINGSTTGEKTISETILNKESDDKMDIYLSSSNLDTTSNVIINGTGIEKGALVVDSETTLTDSIVNGYNTGIYLEQGKFTVINTTINGGGLKNDVAVLKGDENGNIVEILGTSVINGKVELGAGEDSLTIGNSVQINGDLDGGIGEDTLKLGDKELAKTESNLNIYHNINDFENIVFEGDTTLYETSSITGTTNIEIKSGTQVNLRVDSSVQDSDGTYKTHALFNFTSDQLIIKGDKDKITEEDFNEDNNFVVEENESEEGYDKVSILNLVTNGLGREAIIDLGNVKIEDTVWVKTDSIINQATKNETEDGTTITIEAEKDLFSINKEFAEEKYYLELNEIYKGIHSSNDDNFNVLNSIITGTLTDANKGDYTTITDKQQMATLLAYLKQIYTETPYSFSAEASRKSMNVFGDIVKENNFKAKDGEIITYGGLTHNNGEGTDKYYGKNYHGFDIGSADTKVDSKMTGAYGQIEKGISDSTAVGLMLGGNNNKVDIATSDLKGNSAYLGGYVKHDKGAFRGIAGIGIQYSDWDSHRNTMSDSYKENYSDRGLNIYAEGKYTKELTEGLFLEPKVGVSYDYIKQESINESKDKALALEVDGKDFDTLSGNVGLDLRKEIVTEKGKHNLTVGVNYTRILSGADEDNLTGNFGGNSFDILVPQKTKDNVSVGIKYDIELETGVMLGAKVSYDVPFKVSQDNHTHKNEGSWKVGVGIGYRFNTLNDLNPMNIISSSKKDSNITLRTKSYFEFDKAELNNNSKKVIEKFSEKINRDNLKGKIKIEGYTDNVGKSNYNEKLSLERATKVAEELKKQVKNSDTEYEILGKGATNPIGDNETEVGRAKNRRVEIEFQEK